jgi:hypothetical protein
MMFNPEACLRELLANKHKSLATTDVSMKLSLEVAPSEKGTNATYRFYVIWL